MKILAILLACAPLAPLDPARGKQDEFLPLKEGTRWTYAVEEQAADASATNRDIVTEVRGLKAIGETEWTEVSDFLGYTSCFLRVTATGVELKIESTEKAPIP